MYLKLYIIKYNITINKLKNQHNCMFIIILQAYIKLKAKYLNSEKTILSLILQSQLTYYQNFKGKNFFYICKSVFSQLIFMFDYSSIHSDIKIKKKKIVPTNLNILL